MKPITINVQISKCPKQYESVRLGGEWTVDKGETVESAIKAATEELNALYEEMYGKKPAGGVVPKEPVPFPSKGEAVVKPEQAAKVAEPKPKQRLSVKDDMVTVQAIVKRIGAGVKLDKVLEYYEPDEETRHVLELAAKLQ